MYMYTVLVTHREYVSYPVKKRQNFGYIQRQPCSVYNITNYNNNNCIPEESGPLLFLNEAQSC